jgi:hypothetical protein
VTKKLSSLHRHFCYGAVSQIPGHNYWHVEACDGAWIRTCAICTATAMVPLPQTVLEDSHYASIRRVFEQLRGTGIARDSTDAGGVGA